MTTLAAVEALCRAAKLAPTRITLESVDVRHGMKVGGEYSVCD